MITKRFIPEGWNEKTAILDKNKVLMEVKTAGAIPLWMVHFLTEN